MEEYVEKFVKRFKVVVCNAFSLAMLENSLVQLHVETISPTIAKQIVQVANGENKLVSAIGHESTAKLLSKLFEIKIPMNRIKVLLDETTALLIFQLAERLPEGKILNEQEIQELFKQGKAKFFIVVQSSCGYCLECSAPCVHKFGFF